LAAVEVEEFFDVDVDCGWVFELLDFLQGEEVDIVGGVNGLGCAKDVVGDGDAATEHGGVFDVVDSVGDGGLAWGFQEGGTGIGIPCSILLTVAKPYAASSPPYQSPPNSPAGLEAMN
jgi:hypothetical protein